MNCNGKFLKVWEVKNNNGFISVNLGDSRKDKDGNYINWTWYNCAIVGNAKNIAISQGDTIEIKSGIIYQEKYQDKWYTKVTIFDLEVMKRADNIGQAQAAEYTQANFSDDIPF